MLLSGAHRNSLNLGKGRDLSLTRQSRSDRTVSLFPIRLINHNGSAHTASPPPPSHPFSPGVIPFSCCERGDPTQFPFEAGLMEEQEVKLYDLISEVSVVSLHVFIIQHTWGGRYLLLKYNYWPKIPAWRTISTLYPLCVRGINTTKSRSRISASP